MTEKLIAGVDFSGANKAPNETWLAHGRLTGTGLEIVDLHKVGSHALASELSQTNFSYVGIDCPFSLPVEFLDFLATRAMLKQEFQSWQEVAEHIVFMPFDDFLAAAVDFKKEPKRLTDTLLSPAISPLHRGNPSMIQMTYHGMRLLASLDPHKFFVLPYQDSIPFGHAVIEVYPRAALRFLGLPDSGYKSKTQAEEEKTQILRKQILKGLVDLRERKGITFKDFVRLSVNKKLENIVIGSDHALDAVIAAYITANYASNPQTFTDPLETDDLRVFLEGWIYSFRPQQ